jgi:hypothetical protein
MFVIGFLCGGLNREEDHRQDAALQYSGGLICWET